MNFVSSARPLGQVRQASRLLLAAAVGWEALQGGQQPVACDLESQWPRTCTLTPPGHPVTNTSATIKYWCNSRARYTAYWLVSLVVCIIPPPALGQAVGWVAVAAAAGAYTHHHKTLQYHAQVAFCGVGGIRRRSEWRCFGHPPACYFRPKHLMQRSPGASSVTSSYLPRPANFQLQTVFHPSAGPALAPDGTM